MFVNYRGWPNCYRMANSQVELIVTTDVGPRIIRFGFVGQENEFKEYDSMVGMTGGDQWRIYGGHRLWHAPESVPRTYSPDNSPVRLEQGPGKIRLIQPVEPNTGIEKEIEVCLSQDKAGVQVTHRLRNRNCWAIELAPWALTVMSPGGKAVVPLPPRGAHPENLLPTSTMTLWPYTDMSDPRWTWSARYVMLQQDLRATKPQKAGFWVPDGWVAYARAGHLFVKTFDCILDAPYPDLNSTVEVFADGEMLELETLGPLCWLEPEAYVEHTEHWFLARDVPVPSCEHDVDEHILPRVVLALQRS